MHGQTSPVVAVAALLGLSGSWRAGGAGYISLERIDLGAPPPLQDLELHVGYGGLLIERSIPFRAATQEGRRSQGLFARLLLGGGNAEVRNAVTSSRLRSDNFLAVEPAIGFEAPLSNWASAAVVGAYRLFIGVDGLQNIEEENLRGGAIGLSIILGPF